MPQLRPLDRWQQVLADYATSGVTVDDHVMAVLRPRLSIPMLATSAQLPRLPHGCSVAVAGMTIARQRPGTAKGTMFLLFEDEWGTVNLVVPGAVYERHRGLARAEPLLLARGRLERSPSGVLNVIVPSWPRWSASLRRPREGTRRRRSAARVSRLPGADRPSAGGGAGRRRDGGGHARRRTAHPELRLGPATVEPSSRVAPRRFRDRRNSQCRGYGGARRCLSLALQVVCPA